MTGPLSSLNILDFSTLLAGVMSHTGRKESLENLACYIIRRLFLKSE